MYITENRKGKSCCQVIIFGWVGRHWQVWFWQHKIFLHTYSIPLWPSCPPTSNRQYHLLLIISLPSTSHSICIATYLQPLLNNYLHTSCFTPSYHQTVYSTTTNWSEVSVCIYRFYYIYKYIYIQRPTAEADNPLLTLTMNCWHC